MSRAQIRLALVDAHGFIAHAARNIGMSYATMRDHVRRYELGALLREWRQRRGWRGGRPLGSRTRRTA